jgi:hypothetical protein
MTGPEISSWLPLKFQPAISILFSAQAVAPVVWRAACFDLFALNWQANWSA